MLRPLVSLRANGFRITEDKVIGQKLNFQNYYLRQLETRMQLYPTYIKHFGKKMNSEETARVQVGFDPRLAIANQSCVFYVANFLTIKFGLKYKFLSNPELKFNSDLRSLN